MQNQRRKCLDVSFDGYWLHVDLGFRCSKYGTLFSLRKQYFGLNRFTIADYLDQYFITGLFGL